MRAFFTAQKKKGDTNMNVNELILERVRSMIFTDLTTKKLLARLTQIENPSLTCTAEGDDARITTMYRAKTAQFTASNSLFSIDLAAIQFGAEKEVATADSKIIQYCEEMLTIVSNKVTLSHTPKSAVKYVYKFENGKPGDALEANTEADATHFQITGKEITFQAGTSGRIYVEYDYETEKAVRVVNSSDNFPEAVGVKMFVRFRDSCNENLKYYGTIIAERAKPDPTSVELALTSTGKHPFTLNFMKEYCDEAADLFSIIISED